MQLSYEESAVSIIALMTDFGSRMEQRGSTTAPTGYLSNRSVSVETDNAAAKMSVKIGDEILCDNQVTEWLNPPW